MSNSFVEDRLLICNSCPYNESGECILCGCVINDKVLIEKEFCPTIPQKWSAVKDKAGEGLVIQSITTPTPPKAPYCIPCNRR